MTHDNDSSLTHICMLLGPFYPDPDSLVVRASASGSEGRRYLLLVMSQ